MPASESLDIIVKLKDLASKEAKGLGATLKSVAQSSAHAFGQTYKAIFNVPNAIAAVSASVAAQKLIEGVDLAANIQAIEESFKNLTREAGGAKAVLEALQRGTRGTVSDFKLMEIANKAMLLGVGHSAEEFEKLAEVSRRMGRAVGRDATDAFADLTIGMGRESRLILDNLGIIVDTEGAYKDFAKAVGSTVDALSDAEKRTAFTNAVFEATTKASARLGYDVRTLADSWGQFTAKLRNLRDDVLRSLTPLLTELVDGMSRGIKNNRAAIYEFLARTLEGVSALLEDLSAIAGIIHDITGAAKTAGTDIGGGLREAAAWIYEVTHGFEDPDNDDVRAFADEIRGVGKAASTAEPAVTGLAGAGRAAAKALRDAISLTAGQRVARRDSWAPNLKSMSWLPSIEDLKGEFQAYESSMAQFLEVKRKFQAAWVAEDQQVLEAYEKLLSLRSEIYLTQPPPDDLAMIRRAEQEYDANLKLQELYDETWLKERMAMRDKQAELDEMAAKRRLDAQEVARENSENFTLLGGMKAAFDEMADHARQFGKAMKSAILESTDALVTGLSDALWDTISLTKDAGEAFAEMGKKVTEMIGKIFLEMALRTAIGGLFGAFGAGAAAEVPFSMSMYGAKDGGVFGGHFSRVKGHFARGDVARERGLYELREAGQDEAVIPLVGNRYVPVKLMTTQAGGSGGGTVIQNTFNFYGDSRQFARQLRENADTVAAIIAQKQNSSMKFREGMAA